jgi:cell division protein FtsA
MHDRQSEHYFGLDIGTSKVRCVVGMVDSDDPLQLSVIGHGEAPNIGMRKGVIIHVEDVVDAVLRAIEEAERISGINIHRATVNINGSHITGVNSQGVVAISAANREITPEDCIRVEEAATIIQLPVNREIIQAFAKNYRLDGQGNIKDPVGMHGIRLEVDSHIITAASPSLKNLSSVLEKANIGADHYTVSSLAAAEAVLNRQQKESGTLVLDIGAGTTNLVVLEDGEVQHVAVIPMGGINITNDLAIGLKTDLDIAEAVKVEQANLEEKQNKNARLRVSPNGHEHTFSAADVQMIVEARLEELFEYVDKELARVHRSRKLPGGVVLVGGTAKLAGIDNLAKDRLELPARVGSLQKLKGLVDTVQDPAYATAVGLMVLDMLLAETNIYSKSLKGKPGLKSVTSKLFDRFNFLK